MDQKSPEDTRPTILVVDDTPDNLTLMSGLLKDLYRVKLANNGERGLKIARSEDPPDLMLLDVMMPGIDGYEVCRQMKESERTRDIPIVFLTAKTQVEDELLGFELGAADYITKPISPPIVLARVKTQLSLKAASDVMRDKAARLEAEVQHRTPAVGTIQEAGLLALAALAESRNVEAAGHIRRIQAYLRALAIAMRDGPRRAPPLSDGDIDILCKSAALHDVGMAGVPDALVLKPAPLAPGEFEAIKAHAAIGREALLAAERLLLAPPALMRCACDIAFSHHEWWDGSGYPEGAKGEQIPMAARMMAVADAYDAVIRRRPYREPRPHETALQAIREGRGSQFDPEVADAFVGIELEIRAIVQRHPDGTS